MAHPDAIRNTRGRMRALAAVALLTAAAFVGGCKPRIGDACSVSTDCSYNGTRICDVASPGGYCTIQNCESDKCPDDALCVEWRYEYPRTAVRYCMESCSSNKDCKDRQGYRCLHPDSPQVQVDGVSIARITDLSSSRQSKGFCTYVSTTEWPDAGIDGGTDDAGM